MPLVVPVRLVAPVRLVSPVRPVVHVRLVVRVQSCVDRWLLRNRSWLVRIVLASLGLGGGGVGDFGGIPSRLLCEQGWVKSFFFGSRSRSQNPHVQKGFGRSRSLFTGIAIPILMRSFSKKKTPSSGRKMNFLLFHFLKTFNIQILNLSSGREVFQTSHQRDGFSSVCESDL